MQEIDDTAAPPQPLPSSDFPQPVISTEPDQAVVSAYPPPLLAGAAPAPAVVTEFLAGGCVRLAPRGELDLSTAAGLKQRLISELDNNAGVLLDLSDVSFIDSTALGIIVSAFRHTNAHESRLEIARTLQLQPSRLFELTGAFCNVTLRGVPEHDGR